MILLLSFDRSAGPFIPQVEESNLDPLLRLYFPLATCKDTLAKIKHEHMNKHEHQFMLNNQGFDSNYRICY